MTTQNQLNAPFPLILGKGGTNAALTASAGGVVYSGASALAISAVGTSGQLFQSTGTTAPGWTTATFPATAGATGTILRSNGTNWVASTSTFADTYSASALLYSNGANTVTGLATANSSVLITSSGGVPSLSTTLPASIAATNMVLTTPLVTTSIKDTNGATWIGQTATASSVNYVNITNQATNNAPSIAATGSDSDVELILQGKGTGGVGVQGATNGSVVGAGYFGEVISSVIASASAVALTNNTARNVTSIPVTKGNWLIFGNAAFVGNTGTVSYFDTWISLTSATQPDASLYTQFNYTTTGNNSGQTAPAQPFSFSTTTTVYLSVIAGITVACNVCGGIYAMRIG